MRHLSNLPPTLISALLAGGALACGAEPADPDPTPRDGSVTTTDGGTGGSALPVRCPPGSTDPVCMRAGEDNPIGEGPRPRAQVGLVPMLTAGVIDPAAGRLLIGGSWGGGTELAGAVLAVDLATGDRTAISGAVSDPRTGETTIGAGPPLGQVSDVGVRSDGDLVALSMVSTSRLELVRIDADTGDRTLLWYNLLIPSGHETNVPCTDGAGREIPNFDGDSLAIGDDDEIYIVARPLSPGASAVVEIAADASSCAITTLAGESQPEGALRGTGPAITPSLRGLRFADGRLYGADVSVSSLVSIDVATGNRLVISRDASSGRVGEGGALGYSRLDVDVAGGRVLTIDDESGGFAVITEVDLESGDRTVVDLVSNTVHAPGEGGVWFHPSRPLYVSVTWGTAIALVDPAIGEGNLISN